MIVPNIIMIILLIAGIISLSRPRLLLYLVATLPVMTFIEIFFLKEKDYLKLYIGSIQLNPLDCLLIPLFLLIAYAVVTKKKRMRELYREPVTIMLIIMFFWSLIIGYLSYLDGFKIQNVLRNIATQSVMLFSILIPLIEWDDESLLKYFNYLVGITLLIITMGVISLLNHNVVITSTGTLRVLGPEEVVVILLAICYLLFYKKFSRKNVVKMSVVLLYLLLGIALAGFRSGMVALMFILALFWIGSKLSSPKYIWAPLLAVPLFVLIVAAIPKQGLKPGQSIIGDMYLRFEDIFNMQNSTTEGRLDSWEFGLEILKEHPVIGLGRFPVYSLHLDKSSNANLIQFDELRRGAHNMFFEKIIHEGILGLIILLAFIAVVFHKAKKSLSGYPRIAKFLAVYLAAFLLFSLFNTSFNNPVDRIFFFIPLGFLNALKDKQVS